MSSFPAGGPASSFPAGGLVSNAHGGPGPSEPCTARPARAPPPILPPTIFHEPWWMQIASGGAYREAVVSQGGSVVGRLPYQVTRRAGGFTVLGMPGLSHVLGPQLIAGPAGPDFSNVLKQVAITRALILQLPKASQISFRLHGGIGNTLAFDASGYSNRVDYTVELPPGPHAAIWRQMRDKTRNVIRRAEERLTVTESLDARRFLEFYEDNLRRMAMRNSYGRAASIGVIEQSLQRGVGQLLFATDPGGDPQAAIVTVWDHRTQYYFMSTRKPGSLNGAVSLLIWTAIKHAALAGRVFDMDGIHVKHDQLANLHLLTGFGGVIRPRYTVWRASSVVRIGQGARALAIGLLRRRS